MINKTLSQLPSTKMQAANWSPVSHELSSFWLPFFSRIRLHPKARHVACGSACTHAVTTFNGTLRSRCDANNV